jgi:hypothetical protein
MTCDCEIHHGRFLSACFSSLLAVLKLFGLHLCVPYSQLKLYLPYLYVFLNPSRLHYILFSSNRSALLYFSTTTTITKGFGFSVIVYCLSSAPSISCVRPICIFRTLHISFATSTFPFAFCYHIMINQNAEG